MDNLVELLELEEKYKKIIPLNRRNYLDDGTFEFKHSVNPGSYVFGYDYGPGIYIFPGNDIDVENCPETVYIEYIGELD